MFDPNSGEVSSVLQRCMFWSLCHLADTAFLKSQVSLLNAFYLRALFSNSFQVFPFT